ncbi:hypothetical protein [Rhizobium sp. VS19-DR96]|uniref:hypothetical protein n=1 Tax=unclassified Rhizobium TaxID=2613769 RepID=UPI00398C5546
MLSDERFYLVGNSEFEQLNAMTMRMARNGTALSPMPRRDPIFTPLFTSFFVNTLGFSAAAGAIAGSVATAIVTTAVTIGIQALTAQKPPKPEDGKVPVTQAIPYRQWIVGRVRTAGAYMLWEARGKNLYAVQALAGHRIKSVNRYWLHDDEVMIDGSGKTTNDDGGRYGNNVTILSRIGLPTETAYAPIVADLASAGVWTNNHRGDGQASLGMIAQSVAAKNQATRFPYGVPRLSVEADGAYVFDYRISSDPGNPAAWVWSRNAALILCWHQCFNEFGHHRSFAKAVLPVLSMWIEEANICDEDVPLAGGGTEKRYECNGFDTTENAPKVGTNAILGACDGWLCERGDGALLLTVGKFREDRVGILSDGDIVGHQIQYNQLFEDEINRLVPKFTYPATDYTTSDTDFFEDTAAQLEAGRVLAEEADYQWVHQWRQARRLGKREWLRLQQKVKGSIDVRLSGINAVYSRWIRLETPNRMPRLNGKLIENRKSTLSLLQGGFSMDIVQHPENIDTWTPVTDEGMQPPVPSKPGNANLDTPVINQVVASALNGSVYLQVKIVASTDSSLTPSVRYRIADTGGGTPGGWVEKVNSDASTSGGYTTLVTDVVPSDQNLEVEVAFVSSSGKYSDWSVATLIKSTSDPTPPGTPVNLVAPNSATTVPVSARAANDNTRYLVFKRGTTAQSFASATLLGRFVASGGQVVSLNDTPGAGTFKYWCGAENGSGIASTAQASVTTVVT